MRIYSDKIEAYLSETAIIDYEDSLIVDLADGLKRKSNSEVDLIRQTFEYVRDCIGQDRKSVV